MSGPSNFLLVGIGETLKRAREASDLTQEEVAKRAGISRPRYRDIEKGDAAARATTFINVARALGLEVMLVPQAAVPAVNAMLRASKDDDRPAFTSDAEESDDE